MSYLHFHIHDDAVRKLEVYGTVNETLSNLYGLINSLYSSYSDSNPVIADYFKFALTHLVNDSESPLFRANPTPGINKVAINLAELRRQAKGGTDNGQH